MSDLVAVAYVNWGRWLADCPRTPCGNAEHFGPDTITGHVGGLGDTMFTCTDCKVQCPAQWPAEVDRAAIEAILDVRPVPSTRNWRPGEPLEGLVFENVEHGVYTVERVSS